MKTAVKKALNLCGYDIVRHRPETAGKPAFKPDEVVFLHIGKNAGTTIHRLSEVINDKQQELRIIRVRHTVRLRDISSSQRYFFSVRDPVSRFVSGFNWRKKKYASGNTTDFKSDEIVALNRYEQANDLAEALFCSNDRGADAFWAMNTIRHVRDFQSDWFYKTNCFFESRPPVWIVRQEAFEQDFETLLNKLEISLDTSELLQFVNGRQQTSGDQTRKADLSQKARANLSTWYAKDLEFYRVCESWINKGGAL